MRYEISWWQATALFACVHLAVFISYTPSLIGILPPTRDAWLAVLVAAVPGLLLGLIAYYLVQRFEGETLYEFTHTILGKFFGTVVNIAITAYFIHWTTVTTREFSQFLESVVYLRTPDLVFNIIFILLAFVGASQQIEFVGRAAGISAVLVIAGVVVLIAANSPQIDMAMLRPLLGEGWQPVLRQAIIPTVGVFAQTTWIVLITFPFLNKLSDGTKALSLGVGVNTLLSTLGTATLIAIFGPELISILVFSPLSAARLIQLGTVLERIEWILLLMWLGAMGIKVSLLLFGARLGMSSLFSKWSLQTNLCIAAALAFIWSFFLFPTLPDMLRLFEPEMLVRHSLPLPLLAVVLLAIALLRGVKTTKQGEKPS